jgi:hypothetical protein
MGADLKMTCESLDAEFDRQFESTGFALSRLARTHLETCPRCQGLYEWLSSPAPQLFVPPEWSGRVEKALRASLKPVKQAVSPGKIAARLFLVFVVMVTGIALLINTAGLRLMTRGELTGIAIDLIGSAILLSFSLAWQIIPGSLRRVSPGAALCVLGAAFAVTIALLFPWRGSNEFVHAGLYCLRMGIVMAIPAAALFGLLLRRGVPFEPGTLGAMCGALAGLVAATILQARCEMQEATHLLVWHGGVLAVSTVAGWVIGRSVSALQQRVS